MTTDGLEEKRRHRRIAVGFLVSCRARSRHFYAVITNLSQSGMSIRHDDPPLAGSSIDLAFDIVDHGSFRITGTIV